MNKNICLYLHSIANAGGAEKRICDLANNLSNYNFNVHIVTWDTDTSRSFYKLSEKIIWHKIEYSQGIINKLKRNLNLKKIFIKFNINIFIGFVMSGTKSLFISCLISNVKIIVAERNAPSIYYIKYSFFQRFMSFLFLSLSDVIVVQLKQFKDNYPKFLRNKIFAINNPVVIKGQFSKPDIMNKKKYKILLVSRIENQQKNLSLVIKAISHISIHLKSWEITIIGDGQDRINILNEINKFGLNEIIHVVNPISSNIEEYYLEANLFILPSLWEGFSNALTEAMGYGLPIIAYKECEGINNFVINNYNGWLFEKNTYLDLSNKILIAISDNSIRKKYGINSKKILIKNFPVNTNVQWVRLINSINDVE